MAQITSTCQGSSTDDHHTFDEGGKGLPPLTMYPSCQRTKFIANKSLLRYQRLLDTKPNINIETRLLVLAGVSRKLTAWSMLVAADTIPIESEPVNIITISPFLAIAKRRWRQWEQEQHHSSRRVTLEDGARVKTRRKVDKMYNMIFE